MAYIHTLNSFFRLNKYLKYFLKGCAIILSVLVLVYIVIFTYVSINKKKIISQVTELVGKKLNGTVKIGSVDLSFFSHFPQTSVLIHNVSITDTLYNVHHHIFFQAEQLSARLSFTKLISRKAAINGIRIDKGSFYVYTDTSGYTNAYLLNPKQDSTAAGKPAGKNELRSIILNQVRIIIDDQQKNKLHDVVVNNLEMKLDDRDATSFFFDTKANIFVHSLAFNLERGSFIKEKKFDGEFELRYDKKIKQLQFDSIDINLAGHPFNITGRFDLAGKAPQFLMRLHTKQIMYDFGKSLLTPKIDSALSIVNIDKPTDVDVDLSGPLKGGDPLILVRWRTKDAHLVTPFLDFDNATFSGYYSDEVVAGLPRKDPNSIIVVNKFTANWMGLPLTSDSFVVMNLYQPLLTCNLRSDFPLTTLNDIIGSNSIQLEAGNGSVNISYKGPIEKNNNTNSFVNGVISFKNGLVLYAPRDIELKNVNGRLVFKSSDVFIENLQCLVLNNKVIMDGQARNLLTLINTEPNKVNIDWNVFSPSLNLGSFTFLLKSRKKITANNASKRKLAKLASKIDQVLDEGRLHVTLKASQLLYKKFHAANASADITLLPDSYLINNVSMDHAGGHMGLNGSLVTQRSNYHEAKINVNMENVDVSEVFGAFNNFGQDGITSQNLDGKLTAKINASLGVDDEGKVLPSSIQSIVDFSLKDGTLKDFEPVKKLQNFIFKNRDFQNIRFAELKDRLEISNQEVKINRMEIESSVMTMFVEGIYSNKGTTDMSIQVPLSNLKKRGADYNPLNIGTDKSGGIHIRGRPGPDGKIKFKLDLFNKFKKEKDKEQN
ncbi:MAG: AsmA-like C-terminal region-containing protein [Ginsengibacter sp.]